MILENNTMEERLASTDNLVNILTLKRNGNAPVIPPMVKALVGLTATKSNDSNRVTAEVFDIDQSEVARDARAVKAIGIVEQKESAAHGAAVDLMVESMERLKNRLDEVDKPVQLSKIATDMSKIAANLKGNGASTDNRVQVNIYAPIVRKETDYETVEA